MGLTMRLLLHGTTALKGSHGGQLVLQPFLLNQAGDVAPMRLQAQLQLALRLQARGVACWQRSSVDRGQQCRAMAACLLC